MYILTDQHVECMLRYDAVYMYTYVLPNRFQHFFFEQSLVSTPPLCAMVTKTARTDSTRALMYAHARMLHSSCAQAAMTSRLERSAFRMVYGAIA